MVAEREPDVLVSWPILRTLIEAAKYAPQSPNFTHAIKRAEDWMAETYREEQETAARQAKGEDIG